MTLHSRSKQSLAVVVLVLALFLLGSKSAQAQYYSWGADAATLRWQSLHTDDVRLVFPDTASALAHRTLHYIQAVRPFIGHGFSHPPLKKIPFVLHTENFQSNGLVMWMPKRIDFLTSPAVDGYSMPWTKQLVAHEYRHAVQYNNLNRGLIRVLSYLLGQQGSTVGLLFMPLWALEGDAVMSETEMSSYGRGRQPRFTIEYRALGEEVLQGRNCDKWFCGSFREYVPDHYQMGYQMVGYGYTRYGEEIWDKTLRYGVRNAYMLTFSTSVALKKFYNTGEGKLFRNAFTDLNRFWASLPQTEDSGETLTLLPKKNYTTYTHPIPLNDSTLVALKKDFDRSSRFVALDTRTGDEQTLFKTGLVSSRPTTDGHRIWWTEYRRSLLFPERVGSRICSFDLQAKHPRTIRGSRNALYATSIGDDGGLAWVEYTPDGRYTIVINREIREEIPIVPSAEIHGLAWDDGTECLYALITDDSGMWIGRLDPQTGLQPVTQGAYITLSDLRAAGGKLYYGSIASGRDEAHCFDLHEGREYRLSTSAYGTFSPVPGYQTLGKTDSAKTIWTTSYDKQGYRITRQERIAPIPITPSVLPVDVVNPPRNRWDVVNLDTVCYLPTDSATLHQKHTARRYRKGLHLFNAHSWAPASFNPFAAMEEHNPELMLGATVLSQNLLSSTEAYATWGWSGKEGHLVKGLIRYSGLGVRLEAKATYGGDRMTYSIAQRNSDGEIERQNAPSAAKYWSVGANASLPLYFDRGYHIRQLTLSAGWDYSNGLVADMGSIRYAADGNIANLQHLGYREGVHKLSFGIGYSDVVRSAYRDVGTPWGYLLWAGYDFNPDNRNFSDLVSGYARIYTPGFFRHNSLSVAAAYQTSIGGYRSPSGIRPLGYKSTRLLPRGFTSADISSNNYLAGSVDYQFPLCYPEGGISGVIYFKRIRFNAGFDYARFQEVGSTGKEWRGIYSYGADIFFDINILRMSASATATVKCSFYLPSRGGSWFGLGVELPF